MIDWISLSWSSQDVHDDHSKRKMDYKVCFSMLSSTFDRRQSTSEMRLSRTRERFVFTINLWFAKEIRHSNFIQDLVQSVYNWQLMQCLYMWTRVISHVSWSLIFHLRCVFVTLFFDSGSFFERGNGSVERARLSSSADRPINSQVCFFF